MNQWDNLPDEMTLEQFQELYLTKKPAVTTRVKSKAAASAPDWVSLLDQQIELHHLPKPVKEHRFHPTRKWPFDRAWPNFMVAMEVDGGVFGRPVVCHNCGQTVKRHLKNGGTVVVREGGRHNTGTGFENDAEKLNEAAVLGWLVIRVTPKMIEDGRAIAWLEKALQ